MNGLHQSKSIISVFHGVFFDSNPPLTPYNLEPCFSQGLLSTDWSVYLKIYTVELQWFEHPWNHENAFETGVVRADEC